ncbi:MAG: glycosyltransferase [Hyphomicrobiaceae bacterium]
MPRLMFHVQHLLGVGHVARAAALTRGLVTAGISVTVAMGGEPVPTVDFGAAEVVQLPWIRAEDINFKTLLDSRGQVVGPALFGHRRDLLLDLCRRIAPDILLIEHYPFGRRKFSLELEPLIAAAAESGALVLCSLRDVLVEKGDGSKAASTVDAVQRSFDKVLVHGDRRILPLDLTFPRAAEIEGRILYTGYVVDRRPVLAERVEDGRNEIIVSVGGGAVGLSLLEAAIGAKRLGAGGSRIWRLLAGANLKDADVDRLRSEAPTGLIVERARQDFPALLGRAALSISQAGYNTLMDILQARCRNILVPFAAAGESEQLFRARVLERRGLVRILEETTLTHRTLARSIDEALAGPPPPAADGIDLSGAETTARLILAMIETKRG